MLIFLFMFFNFYDISHASVDLYLPEDEVYRLFGIQNSQLYYIRDGMVNWNALDFVARVQPEHNVLKYMWHTTIPGVHVWYRYDVLPFQDNANLSWRETDNFQPLLRPMNETKNSASSGILDTLIPTQFEVELQCLGTRNGNVTVLTKLEINPNSVDSEKIEITIKRLKKCEKTYSFPKDKESVVPDQPIGNGDQESHHLHPHDEGTPQSTLAFYISVSVVSVVLVLTVCAVATWHIRTSKRHNGHGSESLHRMHANSQGNQFLRLDVPNNVQKPPSHSSFVQFAPLINDLGAGISEIQGKLSDLSLPRSNVTLGELILKGTFARIYKGVLEDGTSVLVKTITDEATDEQKRLLLFESSLLRGMHHRNLLTIKHVVLDNAPQAPLVLFPYMEGGNLKHFLQGIKLNTSPGLVPGLFNKNLKKHEQVSTQDLVEMAIQIACGMTYLSKRGLVHKDLAARNCVVDNDLKIKIADYALSRDAFPGDYCCLGDCENRPVRWLGLESLVHKVYSSASDVWSFGVLLWEFQSLAATPYSDIDDFEMADYLSDGFRLSQPINCPDHLYSIMAGCWHYSPDQRPTFTQLFQLLTEFYAELGAYV